MHDLLIIGGGPAGLTAGIYASRARLKTCLLERGIPGGQITLTGVVENYPGFACISGVALAEAMQKQAQKSGLQIERFTVQQVDLTGTVKRVRNDRGLEYAAKAMIIATGADHAKLGVPGEEELAGRGVSYCALCDGSFFRGRHVAVIGGGDSAIDEALYLARLCSKVTVIHRRHQLRAGKILQERALADPRMEFIWDTVVERMDGDGALRSLSLLQVQTGARSALVVEGVFIYVGLNPNTGFLKGSGLKMDDHGHIPTNDKMETNVPGVFAVGDVRPGTLRQVVTAAADGAIAATQAEKYIGSLGREDT